MQEKTYIKHRLLELFNISKIRKQMSLFNKFNDDVLSKHVKSNGLPTRGEPAFEYRKFSPLNKNVKRLFKKCLTYIKY